MHILLADDDTDDQTLFCEAIHVIDSSFTYELANDGDQALSILSSTTNLPDFVFLDINMPRVDGRSCLRTIRSSRRLKDVPVTMISTSISTGDEWLFQMLDADYMVKPNSFDSLVVLLRKYFRSVNRFRQGACA